MLLVIELSNPGIILSKDISAAGSLFLDTNKAGLVCVLILIATAVIKRGLWSPMFRDKIKPSNRHQKISCLQEKG